MGAKGSMSVGTIQNPFHTSTKAKSDLNEDVSEGFWIRWTSREYLEFDREVDVLLILILRDSNVFKIDSVVFACPKGSVSFLFQSCLCILFEG